MRVRPEDLRFGDMYRMIEDGPIHLVLSVDFITEEEEGYFDELEDFEFPITHVVSSSIMYDGAGRMDRYFEPNDRVVLVGRFMLAGDEDIVDVIKEINL